MTTAASHRTFMKVVVQRPPFPLLVLGIIFKIPMSKAGLIVDREQPPEIPKFGPRKADTNRTSDDIPIPVNGAAGTSPWLKRSRLAR
jgi:hypothetical protein